MSLHFSWKKATNFVYVCFWQSSAEVKNLEEQLLKLCNELKQAQIKLDDAENMKRNLQDRSDNSLTFKEVANAQLGCIYLIKNTVNQLLILIKNNFLY